MSMVHLCLYSATSQNRFLSLYINYFYSVHKRLPHCTMLCSLCVIICYQTFSNTITEYNPILLLKKVACYTTLIFYIPFCFLFDMISDHSGGAHIISNNMKVFCSMFKSHVRLHRHLLCMFVSFNRQDDNRARPNSNLSKRVGRCYNRACQHSGQLLARKTDLR